MRISKILSPSSKTHCGSFIKTKLHVNTINFFSPLDSNIFVVFHFIGGKCVRNDWCGWKDWGWPQCLSLPTMQFIPYAFSFNIENNRDVLKFNVGQLTLYIHHCIEFKHVGFTLQWEKLRVMKVTCTSLVFVTRKVQVCAKMFSSVLMWRFTWYHL